MDAVRSRRDEPFGDDVSSRRWLRVGAPVVLAGGRGRPVRSHHARVGACPLVDGGGVGRGDAALRHAQRDSDRFAHPGRGRCSRFSRRAGAPGRSSAGSAGRPAAAGSETAADFVSRFFAPGTGIDEDPVTGSAHCALGPYWSERIGRRTVVGQQLSARGGTVGVEVWGDRVTLTGRAVTIIDGDLVARAGG